MRFKDFWKLGSYINRVTIMSDNDVLYEGTGRKLKVKEFESYMVDSFTVERGLLIIEVSQEEER